MVETLGGGWVAEEALAITLYCALVGADFRSSVLLAVNHSGDSDSTGSMVGNLLGAALGLEALPGEWLEGLQARSLVEQVAIDLAATMEGEPDDWGWTDDRYPGWWASFPRVSAMHLGLVGHRRGRPLLTPAGSPWALSRRLNEGGRRPTRSAAGGLTSTAGRLLDRVTSGSERRR
jgi:hypothetical protein